MVGPWGWGQWRWMSRLTLKISDTGSYSDMVCGLMPLLGFDYRPQLADLPDAKLWRITPGADYGPLNTAARGQIDLGRVRAHWPDLLRLVGSIHTSAVSAHDVLRMLQQRRQPDPARRGAGALRADLQDPARVVLHRSGALPVADQGHAQPTGRPPRPGATRLPRPPR